MKFINQKRIIFILTASFLIGFCFLININTLLADTCEGTACALSGLDKTAEKATLNTSQTSLPTIIGTMINYLLGLVGVILLTVVSAGGFIWMTAGGNEEKVAKGKKWVNNGINGLIVIFFAYGLVYAFSLMLKSIAE